LAGRARQSVAQNAGMTLALDGLHWEMWLRGAVAGLLLQQVIHLLLPGPRRAAPWALAGFAASVGADPSNQR